MERFKQGRFVVQMAGLGVVSAALVLLLTEVDRGLLLVYALTAMLLGAGVGALDRWPRAQLVLVKAPMWLGMLQSLYGLFGKVTAPLQVYFVASLTWYWVGVGLYQYTQHRRGSAARGVTYV